MALYCGDSKPNSIDEFIEDFTQEVNKLIVNVLVILGNKYTLDVEEFAWNCPARAAIKACKRHGGSDACKRCITKGKTVNRRRVYLEMDYPLRTKESFFEKKAKRTPQCNKATSLQLERV